MDTRMVDNVIQARASITMQVLQVPRIFRRMTNIRRIGTFNRTNRSRSQAKENTPFLHELMLFAGSTVNSMPRQGNSIRRQPAIFPLYVCDPVKFFIVNSTFCMINSAFHMINILLFYMVSSTFYTINLLLFIWSFSIINWVDNVNWPL